MRKIITCIGIRPDIIRLSLIVKQLDQCFQNVVVDSGQHYDYNLNKIFYEQLGVRPPDYNLDVKSGTHAEQVGRLMIAFERVVLEERPEFVLVLGDNNSSLGFALATAKANVPLVHVEAGMRSRNWVMPEEKNRTVIDHLADMNLAYLPEHRENLVREGLNPRRIWVVGNPIVDVVRVVGPRARYHSDEPFYLVTCHRAENVERERNLATILEFLGKLHERRGVEVKFVLMPKTKQKMAQFGLAFPDGVSPVPPQGFLEFLGMEKEAQLVITDSGTVVEECAILGKPCLTIRESTERVDLIRLGINTLTGMDLERMMAAADLALSREHAPVTHYGERVAEKICNILLGNSLDFNQPADR